MNTYFNKIMPHNNSYKNNLHSLLEVCIIKSIPLVHQLFAIKNMNWLHKIESGEVRVFGRFVTSKYILKPKDVLSISPSFAYCEPEVKKNFTICFEDDYLLVVNKPAPLPVHPCGTHRRNSLTWLLANNGYTVFSVNRIDSETSGLVFFVKQPQYGKHFAQVLKNANKMYLVLVHGMFNSSFNVNMPLARKENSLVTKRMQYVAGGKECYTRFRRLKYYAPRNVSLLAAFPKTGRTHQIRAHLRELKHHKQGKVSYPVVGDKIYGRDESWFIKYLTYGNSKLLQKETDGLARQFLHASRCSFIHPFTKEKVAIKTSLPSDLKAYLKLVTG